MLITKGLGLCCRDSPEHRLVLGIRRGKQLLDVPVVPAVSAQGIGRIGVQLASNYTFSHSRAATPSDAARVASIQLSRCFGVVLGGDL